MLAGRISSREGRRPITLTQGCGANGYSDDTAARRELGTRLQIGCVATASDDPEHQRRGEVSVNTHAHSFASTCTFAGPTPGLILRYVELAEVSQHTH